MTIEQRIKQLEKTMPVVQAENYAEMSKIVAELMSFIVQEGLLVRSTKSEYIQTVPKVV